MDRYVISSLLVAAMLSGADFSVHDKEPIAMHATGEFDVRTKPQPPDNPEAQVAGIGRLSLDKTFRGALAGTSKGEMLAIGDGKTSGAYVALEKFTGTLAGRSGSFALMHRAAMRQGVPEQWSVSVVPDSGTDALQGIEGELKIIIANGLHSYDFSYSLPGDGQPD